MEMHVSSLLTLLILQLKMVTHLLVVCDYLDISNC